MKYKFRHSCRVTLCLLAGLLSIGADKNPRALAPHHRTWESVDGRFSVAASLVSRSTDSVLLKRKDTGKEVSVPLSKLSRADLLYLLSLSTEPEQALISGTIVGLADGDTVTLLDGQKRQHRVRLEGIDAPEPGQPRSDEARKKLGELVFKKHAKVQVTGKDQYGRTLGLLKVGDTNVNFEMVRAGFAWHYKFFNQDADLADAETKAKAERLGMWADSKPVPPWDWRRMNPDERTAALSHKAPPPPSGSKTVRVRGYYRKDGTYVRGHYRSK